jgi:predicted ATPase
MKIRHVTFKNHPFFGDLDIDFTDKNGNTVNNIILAGENGAGKSRLLNTIFDFTNFLDQSNNKNGQLYLEVELNNIEVQYLEIATEVSPIFSKVENIGNIIFFHLDYTISDITKFSFGPKDDPNMWNRQLIDIADARTILKTIYVESELFFNPENINSITTKNIDINDFSSEKTRTNLVSDITQLLIDIQSLDAKDFQDWAGENIHEKVNENKLDVRLKRFTKAFEFMFPQKKFKKTDTIDDRKRVLFEENGQQMEIHELSSGEKHIVFKASFLLKNKESSRGALIIIDEPEMSLHPNWQLKIQDFYKKLFTDENGEQSSQIIISTHSPFIIHNHNRFNDKVIILKKDFNGQINISNTPSFHSWSSEKLVEEAFNLPNFIDTDLKIVFVEGETDEIYYNKARDIFSFDNSKILFQWIGRYTTRGAENTGDSALNHFKNFYAANPTVIKNPIVLLYDSDTKKPTEEISRLLSKAMSLNLENQYLTSGVENLLSFPEKFDLSIYQERNKHNKIILLKTKLCKAICENYAETDLKQILTKFKNEIEVLL